MPQVTGNLEGNRILLRVGIRPFEPAGPVDATSTAGNFSFGEYRALVDTGARRTCVSHKVTHELQMRRMSQTEVWNVKRPERHWTYLFSVGFWTDALPGESPSFHGVGDIIEGIDVGNHPYFDVLLGMDIISQCSLHLSREGAFKIEF